MIKKKVSVVIPYWKRPGCLNMLLWRLSQGSTPRDSYEVILCDGEPDEDSKHLVSFYSLFMDIIHIDLKSPRWTNPAWPRNVGYRCAAGTYLVMLDADYFPNETLIEDFLLSMGRAPYIWGYLVDSLKGRQIREDSHERELFLTKVAYGDTPAKPLYQAPIEDIFRILDIPRREWLSEPRLYCVPTSEILAIRGYDEDFVGYGEEDSDIYDRLRRRIGEPVKDFTSCAIHIYNGSTSQDGRRDIASNEQILAARLGTDVVRNRDRLWGAPRDSVCLFNYRGTTNPFIHKYSYDELVKAGEAS